MLQFLSFLFLLHACILDVANADAFHHLAYHASIVANDVLYYDGGEVTTWNRKGDGYWTNGSVYSNIVNLPDNFTHSIDLSQSWTNGSVVVNAIPKRAPILNSGALWLDLTQQTIYAYDGGMSPVTYHSAPNTSLPSNQLWSFTPEGAANGTWRQSQTTGNFSNLSLVQDGAYAFGGGLGYAFGGFHWAPSNDDVFGVQNFLPGMVVYNMTSQEWYNISGGVDYEYGFMGAVSQYVPTFGPSGLLLTFGGERQGTNAPHSYVRFDNAFIYEPVSQRWEIQPVSGDKPPPSANSCVAGARGDNGTYEIFLYGGLQQEDGNMAQMSDGSVYVLSLPSFHWFKQPATVNGRYRHTCEIINRQIVVVGGIVVPKPLATNDTNTGGPDPWPNGLAVYDLTAMQWTSVYTANERAYTTPDMIRSYVQQNGQYPPSWFSGNLQTWFMSDSKANSTSSATTAVPSTPSSGTTMNIGAIIGGAVGGVVLLSLIAMVTLFMRRSRWHHPTQDSDGSIEVFDKRATAWRNEKPSELHENVRPCEVGQGAVYELPSHFTPPNGQRRDMTPM